MTLLPLTARIISRIIEKKEEKPLKKVYEEPKLTAETFSVEDVVTTSYPGDGGITGGGNTGNVGGGGNIED